MSSTMLKFIFSMTFLMLMIVNSQTEETKEEFQYRLPGDIIPDAYYLTIRPNYPENTTLYGIKSFKGEVTIDARVQKNTQRIVLSRGSTIKDVRIRCVSVLDVLEQAVNNSDCVDGKKIEANHFSWDGKETETMVIGLSEVIMAPSKIRIVMDYDAYLQNRSAKGFYVSNYISNNASTALLATQLQPTYAREVFPCFDEPEYKATFDLAFQIKEGVGVITNTKEERREGDMVTFHTTPKMSTYLLAFIVYPTADYISTETVNGSLTHKTWARREAVQSGLAEVSRKEGPAVLKYLESYTQIPYSKYMDTLNEAAVPDHHTTAMENWGLVVYQENGLLFDPKVDSATARVRVSMVLAHELAHQWFGDLVTTKWWDTTWINEGFANYFQYDVPNHLHREWGMGQRHVLEAQMAAMEADMSENAPAVTVNSTVATPAEILATFGTTSYKKGGAILAQIRNVMGEENFMKSLRKFLSDNQLRAVGADAVLDALVASNDPAVTLRTDEQLRATLEAWTGLPGCPLLTVHRQGDDIFHLEQERFLLKPKANRTGAQEELYPIYVTWSTTADAARDTPRAPQLWLTNSSTSITIPDLDNSTFVLFNAVQGGYYRVNYDNNTWDRLIVALLNEGSNIRQHIAPLDRAALIDNAMAMAKAGRLDYLRALRVVSTLYRERHFAPWETGQRALEPLRILLGKETAFKKYVLYIVSNIYPRMEMYNAGTFNRKPCLGVKENMNRVNILNIACKAGHKDCLFDSRQVLQGYYEGRFEAISEVQSVVYCFGLLHDDGTLWDKVWKEFLQATNHDHLRRTLITSLGCTQNKTLLWRYLKYSLNSDLVRFREAASVFQAVSSHSIGVEVALKFLEDTGYDTLKKTYGDLSASIKAMATLMTSDHEKVLLSKVLGEKLKQHNAALDIVDNNIKWIRNHKYHVLRDLEQAHFLPIQHS